VPAPSASNNDDQETTSDARFDDEDERTTVDSGPPGLLDDLESRWEEKTRREGKRDRAKLERNRRKAAPPETIDTVDHEEEVTVRAGGDAEAEVDEDEVTVRADDHLRQRLADGSGQIGTNPGDSTMDEPTVDEQAKPLPPLSVMPPIPAGKRGKATPARRPSVATGRLMVVAGNDSGREFDLAGKNVVIGRGVDCDLVLTDIAVSRRHATVEWTGKVYNLRDMGSGNGTLLNDRLEDGVCELRHGDRVELGNTVIRFEHPASKQEPAAVGWGNQVDVDEEVSTIAGRSSIKKGLEAAERGGRPKLVLPPAPPGATQSSDDIQPIVVAPQAQPMRPDYSHQLPQMANAVSLPGARPGTFAPQQRKVLIGVISATLGIVLIAIVATILRGGGDQTDVAAGDDMAATDGDRDPVEAIAAPIEDDEGDAAGDQEVAETAPDGDDQEVAETAPDGDDQEVAEAATDGDQGDQEVAEAATDGDQGDQASATVPASIWGTNEILLASRAGVPAAALKPPAAHDDGDDDGDDGETKVAEAEEPDEDDEPKKAAARAVPRSKTTPKLKRRVTRRAPKKRTATRRATSRSSTKSARSKASGLYKRKDFNGAASALRSAADDASKKQADELRALATNYETVGVNLTKAQSTQTSSPTSSMAAYRRALALDKRIGGSAHAAYIRIKLGQVAPRAAASYMAQKRYEAAKSAADAAVNYGAGSNPTVRRVRAALERKAAAFYKWAIKKKRSNPAAAKKTLRRILKMVPPDSPYYAKAYKLLNARKRGARDEDE
jgi:pSer/pThr/pTyr-binding forkhead associated (FHA) protein